MARAVGAVVRRTGRGAGTSLPGKLLLRMEPQAVERLASRLARGTATISATNGKTTTATMAATILERAGIRLVHNRAGANLPGGIATTLASAASPTGSRLRGELGLFEVDELWLPEMTDALDSRVALLGNLFRDQLDRCGELERIAERWAKLAAARAGRTQLVACADDPLLAAVGETAPDTVFFGVEEPRLGRDGLQHAADSTHCRSCGVPYDYEAAYLAHLGRWRCPACGLGRPEPATVATDIELVGIDATRFTLVTAAGEARIELPLPGLYNVYNALGAAALCLTLGVDLAEVADGLRSVAPAFGRAETLAIDGRPVSVLLVKNPAGSNEVLRTLARAVDQPEGTGPGDGVGHPDGLDLLAILNDRIADGRDTSWVWDVDWEQVAPKVHHITCAGTRAADLALRVKHAGVDPSRLQLVPDIEAALDTAVAASRSRLFVLPTYTAMLELRGSLADRIPIEASRP